MSIYLHPQLAAVWATIILFKIGIASLVIRKPWRHRSWFFTAYLSVSVLRSVLLFGASALDMGWTYTWILWLGSNVLHALAFGVAYDFFRRLFWPYTVLPRSFIRPLLLTLAIITIGVAVLGLSREGADFYGLTLIDRSFTWWVCGLFWLTSAASDRFRIPWRTREYGVCLGFLFSYTVNVFFTGMRSTLPGALFPSLWIVGFCSEGITILIWLHYFMRKEAELVPPSPSERRDLDKLLALFVIAERGVGTEEQQ